jgi:ceramide glucosyltransferase
MTTAIWAAGFFCLAMLLIHLISIAIAIGRCRASKRLLAPPPDAPAVSLVRPVCGLENHLEATLRSGFMLDYPSYEIVFCVARAADPAVPLLRRLMGTFPQVPARLLIGDERICSNPKLNNMVKGWREAAHDWVVFADSNVLMPSDYLQRLLARWRPGESGLVCSPPVGIAPLGVFAELECSFLNTYQARWQYVADSLGLGFAQGKTMLWRREELERGGGIRALGSELAEDAAGTKLVRGSGRKVHLVDRPFAQPLGSRTLAEVWRRQIRWARLRRASFRAYFVPELLAGGFFPLAAAIAVAAAEPVLWPVVVAFVGFWYGAEAMLAWAARWPLTPRTPLILLLRDLLLPVVWVFAWLGSDFVWRGNHMCVIAGSGDLSPIDRAEVAGD